MSKTTKLELTWIGKENRPRLEPRILLEDGSKSYHAKTRVSDDDIFDNRLIQGDNLLALKALQQEFSGSIQCIYIDPPYNTGSAIKEYDDGVEHSLWLSLIRERLELLKSLLSTSGSIWMSIDDNEGHYLKVLADEVFGRKHFIATVIWQKKYAPKADSKFLSESHDFILVYAKDIESVKINRLPKTEKQTGRYTNRDNDPRGAWKPGDTLRNEVRDYAVFPVTLPSGRQVWPPSGTSWRYTKEKFAELIADRRIWFGVDGDARPAIKRFLSEVTDTMPATTIWTYNEVGHNDESKKESKVLFGDDLFGTPKPERLMQRILQLGSEPNDWVLDSFGGSGTTAAVAQKMRRRWITVELHQHCSTHIAPRLMKVIDGSDKGGVTEAEEWTGGGGFRYYHLASSLLERDKFGNWVISRKYNAAMLAEAMCKFEGFKYAPSDTEYWMHGYSTEQDFIYVTTQTLTREQLQKLSDDAGENRSLLVCCSAFRVKDVSQFPNLTIKKIPKMVLNRCEWGRDDYSLEIKKLPEAPALAQPTTVAPTNGRKKTTNGSMNLFEAVGEENRSR